jgi:hypothetical protein
MIRRNRRRRTTGRLRPLVLGPTQFGFENVEDRWPLASLCREEFPSPRARALTRAPGTDASLTKCLGRISSDSFWSRPARHTTAGAPVASRSLRVEPTPREPDRISEADEPSPGQDQDARTRAGSPRRACPVAPRRRAWSSWSAPVRDRTGDRRCGKHSCRCARGILHGPYWYLRWREHGRQRRQYVPRERRDAIHVALEERRRLRPPVWSLRQNLTELRRLAKEIQDV